MVFLRMWMGGGVGVTDMMEMYFPMSFRDPALFVLTARYGGGEAVLEEQKMGPFQGGLRCWIRVGLLVRRELGN